MLRAVGIASEPDGQHEEARGGQAAVELEEEDRPLSCDQPRRGDHEHGPRELEVAPGGVAVEADRQPVRRQPQRQHHRGCVAGERADDDRPHADVRRGQRDRDHERDERDHRLEAALAEEVHPPEEDPERRLERERDRQVGQREGQREQPRLVVDDHEERRRERDQQRERGGQHELERERELELALLVLLVLLYVRLVDADALERDQRHHRDRDDPVEADLAWAEDPRDDQPLRERRHLDDHEEGGVDGHAPDRS